jgi:alcohol dehydrogenase class IV
MVSRFAFPTQILFGAGAIGEVGELALGSWLLAPGRDGSGQEVGTPTPAGAMSQEPRALIVTDAGVRAAGLLEKVAASLDAAGVPWAVFDGVSPNPTEENVEAGIAAYRGEGCSLVIGLGGGSAIDAAKAIRLRATHDLPLVEYDDNIGGEAKIRGDMPPMLAIPTTAGTGSEVGRSAVITLRANARKTVIFSPHLMPTYAVCDPELTLGLPPRITAATGMDALTHSLEAYLARPFHPLCDAIALSGIAHCARSLRRAVEQGSDLAARSDMMMAAMMGAIAFQKGLGVNHSLAHPLSSVAGMHHGTANAVLLPHVLEFNRPACPERYAMIARLLGLSGPDALAAWVRELNAAVGIAPRLRDYGVSEEIVPEMVEKAMQDGCHLNNPKSCTAEDMRMLYLAAM